MLKTTSGQTAEGPFVYHTFYAEYRGATAEELVAALHRDSEAGTGMDYATWWAWQKKLWDTNGHHKVPAPDAPGACAKLIDILLDVGALERGQRPAAPPTGIRAPA